MLTGPILGEQGKIQLQLKCSWESVDKATFFCSNTIEVSSGETTCKSAVEPLSATLIRDYLFFRALGLDRELGVLWNIEQIRDQA